jgi:23S rRNA pseudouridine1911/1915/1917 synthase
MANKTQNAKQKPTTKKKQVAKKQKKTTRQTENNKSPIKIIPIGGVGEIGKNCYLYEYEDDMIIVINKPSGMVVHPAPGNYSGTLVNALLWHCKDSLSGIGGVMRPGIVHRIDKDTGGLLVVAKNDEAQLDLAKQFFVHSIERRYVAIVWGNLKEDEGTIIGNIGRDPNDRMRFKVFPDGDYGKHAVTHYRVLERFGYVTVVECRLETGRTHQIRVHFNWIGHPLFNDSRYDGAEIRKGTIYAKYRQFIENCFKLLPRQALHAKTLGFVHPKTKQMVRFDSPLPADMQALIDKWRKYSENMTQFLEEE